MCCDYFSSVFLPILWAKTFQWKWEGEFKFVQRLATKIWKSWPESAKFHSTLNPVFSYLKLDVLLIFSKCLPELLFCNWKLWCPLPTARDQMSHPDQSRPCPGFNRDLSSKSWDIIYFFFLCFFFLFKTNVYVNCYLVTGNFGVLCHQSEVICQIQIRVGLVLGSTETCQAIVRYHLNMSSKSWDKNLIWRKSKI